MTDTLQLTDLATFPAAAAEVAAGWLRNVENGRCPRSVRQTGIHTGVELEKIEYHANGDVAVTAASPYYSCRATATSHADGSIRLEGITSSGYRYRVARYGGGTLVVEVWTSDHALGEGKDLGSRSFVPDVDRWADAFGVAIGGNIVATMSAYADEVE